jgi:hypothetical protein
MKTFASFAVVYSLLGCMQWPEPQCHDPSGACIPDFSIASNPDVVISNAGASAESKITVSAVNGFADIVYLAVAGMPTGASASFPAEVRIGDSGGGVATLTLQPGSAAVGTYNLTVTGTSGSVNHTATVSWGLCPVRC